MQFGEESWSSDAAAGARPTMSYTTLAARGDFGDSWGGDDVPSTVAAARFFSNQTDPLVTLQSTGGTGGSGGGPSTTSSPPRAVSASGGSAGMTQRTGAITAGQPPPEQVRLSAGARRGAGGTEGPASSTVPGEKPAFKKIPLRSARGNAAAHAARAAMPLSKKDERFNRAANVFRLAAGRTGPVTSDDTVQELAETYAQRRQFMDKASQLTSEMNAKARDIADIDEQNRQMGFKGDVSQLQATIEHQLAEAARRKSSHRAAAQDASGDEDASAAIVFDASGTAEDAVDVKAKEKLGQVLKLRLMQRRIAELDDEAIEEEQRYLLAAKKRQELFERGGYESRRGSNVSSTRSAAASPLASSPQGSPQQGLAHTTGTHSAARLRAPQAPRVTAVELRQQFDALLDGDVASDAVLPDPPRHFTSNALAATLEILSQCLDRVVQATDSVCVSTTFRGTDETVDIFYDLDKYRKNYAHALLCLSVATGHLTHFEIGEKAMVEGGQFEVNSLREQTLIRKEMLTAQEQKENSAEEDCKALRQRLRKLRERTAMWDEVIFGNGPSLMYTLNGGDVDDAALAESVLQDGGPRRADGTPLVGRPSSQGARASAQAPGSRRATHFRALGSARGGVGSRGQRKHSSSPVRLTTLVDFLDHHQASGSMNLLPVPAAGDMAAQEKPLSALYATEDVPLSAEDAMELRVARTWGNPYVTKALQYQQVTHLLPLYQRQLELQQQQQQQQQQGVSQQTDYYEPQAARPSEWPQRVARGDSVSAPAPAANGLARLSAYTFTPSSRDGTAVLPAVIATTSSAVDAETGLARPGDLSLATTTIDSAGVHASADTMQPCPTASTSARQHPLRLPTPLPPPPLSGQRVSLAPAGGNAGSVRYSCTAPPGVAGMNFVSRPSLGYVTSQSLCTDASRNGTLPTSTGPQFVSQRIANERVVALLQALVRVMPTERAYTARFHQGMSDDDDDDRGGAVARKDKGGHASPKAHAGQVTASSPLNAGRKRSPPSQGHGRPEKKGAPSRLVAYDVALSTEEKAELAYSEAARASAERLLQVVVAQTKGNTSRMS